MPVLFSATVLIIGLIVIFLLLPLFPSIGKGLSNWIDSLKNKENKENESEEK